MERELKYKLELGTQGRILQDKFFLNLVEQDQRQIRQMSSAYYDSQDRRLSGDRAVCRIRREDDREVLTIKAGQTVDTGLFCRKEWEMEIGPDLRYKFQQGLTGEECRELASQLAGPDSVLSLMTILNRVADQPLVQVCAAEFMRESYPFSYEGSTFELAIDHGFLYNICAKAEFAEMEVELLEGEVSVLSDLNQILLEKLMLEPENLSKFQRAIKLQCHD